MKHLFSVVALVFVLLFGIAPPAAHAQWCDDSGSIPMPACSGDNYCHAEHAYAMGVIYENGLCGMPQDAREANAWFRKAAELGHAARAATREEEDAQTTNINTAPLLVDRAEAESVLLDALRLKPGITDEMLESEGMAERKLDSRKMIAAFAKSGYINLKPEQQWDYQHFHSLKKPAYIFGHEIVLIDEEYSGANPVGCCVDPGVAITVKVNGNTSTLQNFAKSNKCKFSRDAEDIYALDELLPDAPKGTYAHLSCKAYDWQRI